MQVVRQYAMSNDGAALVLTEREEEVLAYVAAGFDHATISRALGISRNTTVCYMARLSSLAGASNRQELAMWAVLTGLIAPAQIWGLWAQHRPALAAWQERELRIGSAG